MANGYIRAQNTLLQNGERKEKMVYLEVCDLCKAREANRKFKVKMSKKIDCIKDIWSFYEKVSICEGCAEKLLGVKSSATIVNEIVENIREQTEKNKHISAQEIVEFKQKQNNKGKEEER